MFLSGRTDTDFGNDYADTKVCFPIGSQCDPFHWAPVTWPYSGKRKNLSSDLIIGIAEVAAYTSSCCAVKFCISKTSAVYKHRRRATIWAICDNYRVQRCYQPDMEHRFWVRPGGITTWWDHFNQWSFGLWGTARKRLCPHRPWSAAAKNYVWGATTINEGASGCTHKGHDVSSILCVAQWERVRLDWVRLLLYTVKCCSIQFIKCTLGRSLKITGFRRGASFESVYLTDDTLVLECVMFTSSRLVKAVT